MMIRLLIEGSERLAIAQASVRGIKNIEVLSYNKRAATTVLRVSMNYWPAVLEWWKASEVGGLRRTLNGSEVVG